MNISPEFWIQWTTDRIITQSKNEKSLRPRGHFPLSLSQNNNDSAFQSIWTSHVDMTIIRAMLPGSWVDKIQLPYEWQLKLSKLLRKNDPLK